MGVVTVTHIEEFDKWITSNPEYEKLIDEAVRVVMKEAAKLSSKDAKGFLDNDPRQAYKAVKYRVYKKVFGGNFNILNRKRAGKKLSEEWVRSLHPRKIDSNPTQRGGNRRERDTDKTGRNRLDYYNGTDRGFILRFLGSGTTNRTTRYGNRGSIRGNNWFDWIGSAHMDDAIKDFDKLIVDLIEKMNNKN